MSSVSEQNPVGVLSPIIIGGKLLQSYRDSYRDSLTELSPLQKDCLALYTLVKKETLPLVSHLQIWKRVQRVRASTKGQNLIMTELLKTIEKVCQCFSRQELRILRIDIPSGGYLLTSYGFELGPDQMNNLYQKVFSEEGVKESFHQLVQGLNQICIQQKNLGASLEGETKSLDTISQALENLLPKSGHFPFSERRLALICLKRLMAFEVLITETKDAASFQQRQERYQKIDQICRTFSVDRLLKWGIVVGNLPLEECEYKGEGKYEVSDSVLNTICEHKMRTNAGKASSEHIQQEEEEDDRKVLLTLEEAQNLRKERGSISGLNIQEATISTAEIQGNRSYMQDAFFVKKMEIGIVAGVFDGHGEKGDLVANKARDIFSETFPKMLQNSVYVYDAFLLMVEKVQQHLVSQSDLGNSGATAVICFVDNSGKIYTATIGDCEAFLFKRDGEEIKKCLPCSVVRNWGSEKDKQRVRSEGVCPWQLVYELRDLYGSAEDDIPVKERRIQGLNVSRTFGDEKMTDKPEHPGVIHKPKIAVIEDVVEPKDILMLTSDGVVDATSKKEIVSLIKSAQRLDQNDVAGQFVKEGVEKFFRGHLDNISVITIQF